jgi:hypothetical protein
MNNSLQVNLEALRGCLQDLEESIADLLQTTRLLPGSDLRNRLLDEVSALDSIAASMRQALDLQPKSTMPQFSTPPSKQYIDHPVHDRLYFAERRLNDLRSFSFGDLGAAAHRDRQSLVQEFFFHLCGAIDFLAQEVNSVRRLGISKENVSVASVRRKLTPNDPIRSLLLELHPSTRKRPLPTDPYSEESSHFRIMLLRNFVSHIRHNPFSFCISIGSDTSPSAHFFLDPRKHYVPQDRRTPSKREAIEEMITFLGVVRSKCDMVLKELQIL